MKRFNNKGLLTINKTRNIASAVYLVTDLIPESDPIRYKIREVALETVSVLVAHSHAFQSGTDIAGKMIRPRLTGLLYFLDMARISGVVSRMNHELLVEEISKQLDSMSRDDLIKIHEGVFKKMRDDRAVPARQDKVRHSIAKRLLRTEVADNSHNGHSADNLEMRVSVSNSKIDRRESILKALSNQKSLSVRDIMSVIKDVSEKTIQRDLVTLVKENVLKRVGEKDGADIL